MNHQELALGTYDGFSGLFTQPIKGGIEEGGVGVAKGFGKGIMGAIVKPFAGYSPSSILYCTLRKFQRGRDKPMLTPLPAASGVLGYSLKGIDKEITKSATQKIFNPIISAREAQGELEYREASKEEKNEIIQRWCAKAAEKKISRRERKKLNKTESKGKGQEMVLGDE